MIARLASAAVAAAIVGAVMTGCSAPAVPAEPTPLFSSEEEAFAAAEETYRAYVDALNAVDLSDPATFEDVYAWTTGEANAGARESFSQMHADGWSVAGESKFDHFAGRAFSSDTPDQIVIAELCIDVTDVDVRDESEESVVPESRKDRQPVSVTFAIVDSEMLIAESTATDDAACG